jgi:hypothetical protein
MTDLVEYTDQDARRLLKRLGSFWHTLFDGQDQLLAYFRSRACRTEQRYWDFLEAYDCAVHADIPVFHREHWGTLALVESELTRAPLRYGEDGVDFGGGYRYGRSYSESFYMKLPKGVKRIAFLHDNPLLPTVTFVEGVDFRVEDGLVYFYRNPFIDKRLTPMPLFRDGVPVDRGLVLWREHSYVDRKYVLSHLGAALKLHRPSSKAYKRAAVALARLYTAFPSRAALTSFLNAMIDAPTAIEPVETVEVILDRPSRQVVTDRHVYDIPEDAKLLVKVGDSLKVGDPLTDAAQYVELAYGLPGADIMPALTAGAALLLGPYQYELTFPNEASAVWQENGMSRFKVIGAPHDVAAFWRGVDARGGLPALGATANPAQLLLSCLRGHGVFIRLNARSFGTLATPSLVLDFLRRALAPRLVVLSYMELAAPAESIQLVEPVEDVRIIRIYNVADNAAPDLQEGVTSSPISNCER